MPPPGTCTQDAPTPAAVVEPASVAQRRCTPLTTGKPQDPMRLEMPTGGTIFVPPSEPLYYPTEHNTVREWLAAIRPCAKDTPFDPEAFGIMDFDVRTP